jgi:hypothetical protein
MECLNVGLMIFPEYGILYPATGIQYPESSIQHHQSTTPKVPE